MNIIPTSICPHGVHPSHGGLPILKDWQKTSKSCFYTNSNLDVLLVFVLHLIIASRKHNVILATSWITKTIYMHDYNHNCYHMCIPWWVFFPGKCIWLFACKHKVNGIRNMKLKKQTKLQLYFWNAYLINDATVFSNLTSMHWSHINCCME